MVQGKVCAIGIEVIVLISWVPPMERFITGLHRPLLVPLGVVSCT